MPIDPNAPTSDIGMMYRQYLQSKGMPLTNENLQRVISQSQREPGMIQGLSVQAPEPVSAPAPPNVAGASPSSSGAPPSVPRAVPTNMPMPTPPIPPSAPTTPTAVSPQVPAQQTPLPGQAPAQQQSSIMDIIQQILPALIGGGAGILGGSASRALIPGSDGGGYPGIGPGMRATPEPDGPVGSPRQSIAGPRAAIEAPTATSPIGNILSGPRAPTYGEGALPTPSPSWSGEGVDTFINSGLPHTPAPVGSPTNYPGATGHAPSAPSAPSVAAKIEAPIRAPRARVPAFRLSW
jgi:hypothetical protein